MIKTFLEDVRFENQWNLSDEIKEKYKDKAEKQFNILK